MAGRNATHGTRQLGLEVDADLVGQVKEFAKARGETLRKVVETALRRHMTYPPPVEAPLPPPPPPPVPPPHPFPDAGAAPPVEAPARGRKSGKK